MKKKLIGYRVDEIDGNMGKVLNGTQPRRLLDKLRKTHIVRKIYASRKHELVA